MHLRIFYYCISICRSYYSKHHSLHSYSIAFLCRSKVLLHTCIVWMDLSLSILHLYLQRYFFSIIIFISYSYSPEGNIKNYILKQEFLLTLNFCTIFTRWVLFGINDSLKNTFLLPQWSLYASTLLKSLEELHEYSVWVCLMPMTVLHWEIL